MAIRVCGVATIDEAARTGYKLEKSHILKQVGIYRNWRGLQWCSNRVLLQNFPVLNGLANIGVI